MLSTIIGAFIGMIGTLLGGWIAYWLEKRNQECFAATVLYNDLKSIERYLAYERSSVNLRFSNNWQHMVADCSFLKSENIEKIYIIYDEVYNYNYKYQLIEKVKSVRKEDIDSYKKLQKEMFDTSKGYIDLKKNSKEYEELIKILKKHIK